MKHIDSKILKKFVVFLFLNDKFKLKFKSLKKSLLQQKNILCILKNILKKGISHYVRLYIYIYICRRIYIVNLISQNFRTLHILKVKLLFRIYFVILSILKFLFCIEGRKKVVYECMLTDAQKKSVDHQLSLGW